jgi:hypothetical protein
MPSYRLPAKRFTVASGTVDYLAVTTETRLAKPLPNDSRIFCFQYSGFQAARHNIITLLAFMGKQKREGTDVLQIIIKVEFCT